MKYWKYAITSVLFMSMMSVGAQKPTTREWKAAKAVIESFAPKEMCVDLKLDLPPTREGNDCFSQRVERDTLFLRASSPVALCRGFYDYMKQKGAGICSWTGNRSVLPTMETESEHLVVSPYRHHYYLNVVTYGYTMPYWDEQRWDKEIDWMALHGIDMPLMMVATEAIMERAFLSVGLSKVDISDYFSGAAHLPWQRMGNLSGASLDGPLTKEWHGRQIVLAHHILKRMRALKMKPICPAFAGFVPESIKKLYPQAKISRTSWANESLHNWRLDPSDPLFYKLGRAFIEEWEKEFGKCYYYLSDSFNEMSIPSDLDKLAEYGERIYASIHDSNPKAQWVLQGWMFLYQRELWNKKRRTMEALFRDVPNDGLLVLDLATDYNRHFTRINYNWEEFDGFYGKEWVWSVIPNMGGKCAPTGVLEFYANGRLDALRSSKKGQLVGYGFAPEGIENNALIYELLSDGGWTADSINLREWLRQYDRCRYGVNTKNMDTYYDELLQGVYNTFTDHPRFAWQLRPGLGVRGTVHVDKHLFAAVDALLCDSVIAKKSELLRIDMVEAKAMRLGALAEKELYEAQRALKEKDKQCARKAVKRFETYMLSLDELLAQHPLWQEEVWEQQAKKRTQNPALQEAYARNARRLVTIWEQHTNTVVDYAARVWRGLVKDYYLPRWKRFFKEQLDGTPFDIDAFSDRYAEEGA